MTEEEKKSELKQIHSLTEILSAIADVQLGANTMARRVTAGIRQEQV